MPRLQLVLPAPTAFAARREGPPRFSYWLEAAVPREWRHSPDAELRLEVPTARLELGKLSLSSQLEAVPGRERDCAPDCRAPEWSPSLRLKYDTGDVGVLRQTGPQLELEGARPPGSGRGRRFFGAGFSGKF